MTCRHLFPLLLGIRWFTGATLAAALAAAVACAPASETSNWARGAAPISTPPAAATVLAQQSPAPSSTPAVSAPPVTSPSPSAMSTPSPTRPSPSPTSIYGCPQGPCPSSLQYAVNGCICAGQVYEDSRVTATYCCKSGFSDTECPEPLEQQRLAESIFGATQEEIEASLVVVTLQGWEASVHEKAAPAFRQVAARIENMDYRIREPVESYSYRNVGGHEVLSMHSFGIAVDINPSTNPSCGATQACRCYNDLITDMPPEFVQAFKDAGFEWGGDWVEHPDPMHFEWAGWR